MHTSIHKHLMICNSYNMGTSALPDTYARRRTAGPRAEGIHARVPML